MTTSHSRAEIRLDKHPTPIEALQLINCPFSIYSNCSSRPWLIGWIGCVGARLEQKPETPCISPLPGWLVIAGLLSFLHYWAHYPQYLSPEAFPMTHNKVMENTLYCVFLMTQRPGFNLMVAARWHLKGHIWFGERERMGGTAGKTNEDWLGE